MRRLLLQFTSVCLAAATVYSAVAARADEAAPNNASLPSPIRFAQIPPEAMPLPPIEPQLGRGQITLAEAEAMALSYHPLLRAADGRVRAARGAWLQAGLRPNPEIGYSGNEIGNDGAAGQQGGYVSQEFVTAGKLGLSRAVASREVSAAEQRLERSERQLITTVRIYYVEVLAADRAATLAQQLEAMAAQSMRASELRLEAQEGSRAALLQSQVEYESARLLVEQANHRREAAWRRLASVLGVDAASRPPLEDKLADPLPTIDWETARARLLAESPELAELRADVERSRYAVERATAGRIPNVNVLSGVAVDQSSHDTIANVQVSMPLPVFDRNQGNVARACGELTAAQAAVEGRELELTQRLAAALRDYHTASRRVAKFTETILPAARQSLELVSQAYQQGELDYLQLLATQRTYTEKNIALLQDLETAWKKWSEIDGLMVGTLPDGID